MTFVGSKNTVCSTITDCSTSLQTSTCSQHALSVCRSYLFFIPLSVITPYTHTWTRSLSSSDHILWKAL